MNKVVKKWKVGGELELFPHQWVGVEEMEQWFENGHGGICADEMGLGKTCTTIVTLTRQYFKKKGPFFILTPLSVAEHWERELTKFSDGHLEPFKFTSHESVRQEALDELEFTRKTVFITSGHILRQESTLKILRRLQKKLKFTTFVIDEAQCVKTPGAQLTKCMNSVVHAAKIANLILLTGTPIQNNLNELYSLLTLADPTTFFPEGMEDFSEKYTEPENMPELKKMLKKYLFRRTKEEVFKRELKNCEQVILYHGISDLQKDVYKNIVHRNAAALRDRLAGVNLGNVLMEIRKCVIHPYIIPGVEPEPFVEGEHLVDASGKLQVLDRLLKYMIPRGHRALIFSQFLGALDIIEDLFRMREWKYVRISGDTRIEERVEFVDDFQDKKKEDGPVCFLLSTKAGGVGLNLTAADTAIFFDSDWNPQNDIQAMARCHRIGQTKPVKIIRLVGRSTIDQYVVATAREKLKLTDAIIGGPEIQLAALDVVDSLQRDFETLMNSKTDKFECTDEELEQMIGGSSGDAWLPIERNSDVVRFLDPNECDEQDIDKNDYTKWEGKSHKDATYTGTWDRIVNGNVDLLKRRRAEVDYSLNSPSEQRINLKKKKTEVVEVEDEYLDDEGEEEAEDDENYEEEKQKQREKEERAKLKKNGYSIYLTENKGRIMLENPNVSGNDLTKIYSVEWSKLSKEEKLEYHVKGGYVEKEKAEKLPSGFAFHNFRSQVEKLFRDENPDLSDRQVVQTLVAQWKALTQKSRSKYGRGFKANFDTAKTGILPARLLAATPKTPAADLHVLSRTPKTLDEILKPLTESRPKKIAQIIPFLTGKEPRPVSLVKTPRPHPLVNATIIPFRSHQNGVIFHVPIDDVARSMINWKTNVEL